MTQSQSHPLFFTHTFTHTRLSTVMSAPHDHQVLCQAPKKSLATKFFISPKHDFLEDAILNGQPEVSKHFGSHTTDQYSTTPHVR